jgi:hypothetical protein
VPDGETAQQTYELAGVGSRFDRSVSAFGS